MISKVSDQSAICSAATSTVNTFVMDAGLILVCASLSNRIFPVARSIKIPFVLCTSSSTEVVAPVACAEYTRFSKFSAVPASSVSVFPPSSDSGSVYGSAWTIFAFNSLTILVTSVALVSFSPFTPSISMVSPRLSCDSASCNSATDKLSASATELLSCCVTFP